MPKAAKLCEYRIEVVPQEPPDKMQAVLDLYTERGFILDKCWPTTVMSELKTAGPVQFQQAIPAIYCIFAKPTKELRKPWEQKEPWQEDEEE